MKIGITRFPGTNCDFDVYQMVKWFGAKPIWLWHQDPFDVFGVDAIIIPGGFSYGDYLRCGALASRSVVMKSVKEFSQRGGPILGICNGFQILCESGLLPGVLLRNEKLTFIDDWVDLKMEHKHSFWAQESQKEIRLPIAHGEGRYFLPSDELKRLEDHGQVWFRYKNNPNGSVNNIAGVMNIQKNVAALMPHPERALETWMGGDHGGKFL